MSDAVSGLTEREIAELAALADGSLPAERRAEVEARIAASPELLALVEQQRKAVAATHALSGEAPPASLVESVEALRSKRKAPRARFVPRLALAGGLAAVAAVVAAIVLSGGPGGPTVADAARLASEPPTAPAPPPLRKGSTKLALDVQGVAFPNLARWAGWHTVGVRRGRIDGRNATAVFYRRDGRRIAYVIVAGSELSSPSGAEVTTRAGVQYRLLRLNGRLAVTWPRGGHTCVLTGAATRAELLKFASWKLTR
jgi:anti-sigma factor RsiW